jgi:hypothetical protein
LALMGVGNVRCTPPVLATLASYFGERPLEIVLYDADEERLDLFDRLARTFLAFTKSTNMLSSTIVADEALTSATRVIVQLDSQGARKALGLKNKAEPAQHAKALVKILSNLSPTAEVLSLLEESVELPVLTYRRIDWPPALREAEVVGVPHQALRWIHGEEYPFEFFAQHEDSPLKLWLDEPASARLVRPIAE